jgi:hypothetical protein
MLSCPVTNSCVSRSDAGITIAAWSGDTWAACDGSCVEVGGSDPNNCGQCGHECSLGQECVCGSCESH